MLENVFLLLFIAEETSHTDNDPQSFTDVDLS